ncbi:MAG: 5-formyltetrahydrofolate cyclo-ligase [Chitinophagaceae bacterium]|nr:5-formyltetrahydrofolate cyclo-ligase [Chitinophagaceae bacterium]
MNKNGIRKIYSEKRKKLSGEAIQQMTGDIVKHFSEIGLQHIRAVLSYSPIESRREFNISFCEKILQDHHPAISIAHPRIIQDSNFMEAVVVGNGTPYLHNSWSVPEPSHGEILTPESFDLVLVPLLAFDKKGFRVGYGKGFYDRWLAQCRPEIRKIGFSFFEAVEAIDDINEFDVPLNLCITPMRVYEF